MEKLPQEARYAEAPSEEKNLDYFMKKMRERVTAYHNQSSQAEVKDRGGLYRNQLSTDRIKEAAAYRAEQKKQFGQSEKVQEKYIEKKIKGKIYKKRHKKSHGCKHRKRRKRIHN